MGAFGLAIFSDDNAADLRADYRDLIGEGLIGSEATDRLIKEWAPDANDAYFAATFWLALALTQWNCGRLEERAKARALSAIADGSALEPWRGKQEAKRRAVLEEARRRLESQPPAPVKIKRRILCECSWEPTELIAYRLSCGDHIVLRVTDLSRDKGGTYPSCELLDWQGAEIPGEAILQSLPLRPVREAAYFGLFQRADRGQPPGEEWSRIMLLGLRDKLLKGRFTRLGIRRGLPYAPLRGIRVSGRAVLLKNFDQDLEEWYGFR